MSFNTIVSFQISTQQVHTCVPTGFHEAYNHKGIVWHLSLPLMNSFNKTEAAIFPCRLCFLKAFPFISLLCRACRACYYKDPTLITNLYNVSTQLLKMLGLYLYTLIIGHKSVNMLSILNK